MTSDIKFGINRITGDGSCFYRSVFNSLLNTDKNLVLNIIEILERKTGLNFCDNDCQVEEEKFIVFFRRCISKMILDENDYNIVRSFYDHIKSFEENDIEMLLENKSEWVKEITKNIKRIDFNTFKRSFSNQISNISNWADELDIQITKNILTEMNVKLHILNVNNDGNIKIYEKLLRNNNNIYIINIDEQHYVSVVLTSR